MMKKVLTFAGVVAAGIISAAVYQKCPKVSSAANKVVDWTAEKIEKIKFCKKNDDMEDGE